MRYSVSRLLSLLFICLTLTVIAAAQVPTGALRGTVTDPSKAVISGAVVTIKQKETGVERSATTKSDGVFVISNLLPGEYEIKAAMQGFKTYVASVTIQVGNTSNTEISMDVGGQNETVVISGDSTSVVNTSDFKVDGVMTRQKIDSLPLNGRNYLALAGLEPGVRVGTNNPGDANSLVTVSVGGAPSNLTRLTVDGGSIVDYVTGGAGQNFSIESVQEFQISSFNFDLPTGVTSVGSINIITRTGGNDYHGAGFAFYRDHNISAYPVLNRDPSNPDPFFRRLQSGFSLGGPIRKDKVFGFFNYENLNQDAVYSTVHTGYRIPGTGVSPLSQFDTVSPSPFDQNLTNARVDYTYSARHSFFARYSGDTSKAFAPVEPNVLPSNWRKNKNNSYQGQGAWTWIARPNLTNDLRFNWNYVGNKSLIPTNDDCPNCFGLNGPQIRINGSSFRIGNQIQAPQNRALHRYETTNNSNLIKGKHLIQFGGTWEKDFGRGNWNFIEPSLLIVHNPADIIALNGAIDQLAAGLGLPASDPNGQALRAIFGPAAPLLKIPIPAAFTTPGAKITYQDILNLPLAAGLTGIGDGSQPPPFNADIARRSSRFRFYGQDTWRTGRGLTLKYGLSYTYENNLYNHDLVKPSLLSPLYGTTNANKRDTNNFAPSAGFAWDVKNNAKTVIRGGASMFYDTSLFVNRLTERALIGPLGNGRVVTDNNFFVNTIQFPQLPQSFIQSLPLVVQGLTAARNSLPANDPNRALLTQLINIVPGLPLINPAAGPTALLTNQTIQTLPTKLTAANFISILNQQVPVIQAQLNALGGQGVKGLDFFKTASGNGVLIDPNAKLPYSVQFSIGVQRELPFNMLLTADFVSRNRVHTYFVADRNQINRAASLGGPLIRQCVGAEAVNPTVRCTNGPVEILDASGREQYKALLVKLDKRFARRYAFTASYALSSLRGFDYTRDLNNLFGNSGYLNADARHVFALNSVVDLPYGFQAGFIANLNSSQPFSATLNGLPADTDINGDGTGNDLLPGFGFNKGNRGISVSDLRKLVDAYNQNFAGKTTPRGGTMPTVTLPSNYQFGDIFQSYDARLSKNFKLYQEKLALELIAEVFNMFNISNLSGFNGRLDPSFGQPTAKAGQAFGFGGPRAWQFAGRIKF